MSKKNTQPAEVGAPIKINLDLSTNVDPFEVKDLPQDENVLYKSPEQIAHEKWQRLEKEESVMVTGIFKNLECPKLGIKFPYRKFKSQEIEWYEMEEDVAYTVPLAVAKHLANETGIDTYEYVNLEKGGWKSVPSKKSARFAFHPTKFIPV